MKKTINRHEHRSLYATAFYFQINVPFFSDNPHLQK